MGTKDIFCSSPIANLKWETAVEGLAEAEAVPLEVEVVLREAVGVPGAAAAGAEVASRRASPTRPGSTPKFRDPIQSKA